MLSTGTLGLEPRKTVLKTVMFPVTPCSHIPTITEYVVNFTLHIERRLSNNIFSTRKYIYADCFLCLFFSISAFSSNSLLSFENKESNF